MQKHGRKPVISHLLGFMVLCSKLLVVVVVLLLLQCRTTNRKLDSSKTNSTTGNGQFRAAQRQTLALDLRRSPRAMDRSRNRRAIAKRSGEDCVERDWIGVAVGESVLDRLHRGTIKIQMKANAGFSLVSFIKYDVSAIPLCIIKSFVKGSAFVCLVRWAMNK